MILFTGIHRIMSEQLKFIRTSSFSTAAVTFLNDYEGIGGYEKFRADLALMYFATVEPSTGKILDLQMTPTQIRRFKVNRATRVDTLWLRDTLNREGAKFGTRVKLNRDNRLALQCE